MCPTLTTDSNPASRKGCDRAIQRAETLLVEGSIEAGGASQEKPRASSASSEKVRQWMASRNYQRALELIKQKDFFPAVQMLEEAVVFAPDNADYRYLLGRAKMKNPRWREEGIEHLEEAVRIEPARADIQGALAEAYLALGAFEKALACARTALNVAPLEEKAPYRELEIRVEEAARLAGSGRPLIERLLGK